MWQSNRKQLMNDAVPGYYRENIEAQAIINAHAELHDQLYADTQDVLAQFFVESATWGLAHWERIFGVETNEAKPLAERRPVVKARMRGIGVVSQTLIKDVAESWYGGEVAVSDQPAQHLITVKFVSSIGVPTNLGDVERALRELIPAHLALQFEFTYILIRDIDGVKTLAELEQLTLDQFAG